MAWTHTQTRQQRGYGAEWQRTRKAILLRDNYLCVPCTTNGRVTPATQVDHIKPKADGGTDEHTNLQSICTDCHKIKTAQDSGYTPKQQIGLDGWPTN